MKYFYLVLLFAQWPPAFAQCPVTDADAARARERIVRDESFLRLTRDQRVLILRITCEDEKEGATIIPSAYAISYSTGRAFVARLLSTGVRIEDLPGVPQASAEEREEARALIRRELRSPDDGIIGGFVVDPPPNSSPGRYLEFHVVTRERDVEVIVDLASSRVLVTR